MRVAVVFKQESWMERVVVRCVCDTWLGGSALVFGEKTDLDFLLARGS